MSDRTKIFPAVALVTNGKTTTTSLLALLQSNRNDENRLILDYPQERGICLYNPYIPINHFAVEPNAQNQLPPALYSSSDFQLNLVDQDTIQDSDYVLVEEENIDDDYDLIDINSLRM